MHGLIQAFSRTNRILNSIKTFGNIVCFRNLQKRVDAAISLFGDKNAGGIVLMKSFKDYYYGLVRMEHFIVVSDGGFQKVAGVLVKCGGIFWVLLVQNAVNFLLIRSITVNNRNFRHCAHEEL